GSPHHGRALQLADHPFFRQVAQLVGGEVEDVEAAKLEHQLPVIVFRRGKLLFKPRAPSLPLDLRDVAGTRTEAELGQQSAVWLVFWQQSREPGLGRFEGVEGAAASGRRD